MLLVYRLPREPSRHRVAVWRKLRDLGALYLQDGVAALPEDAVTREQLEWLQLRVREAGGKATLWEARPGTLAEEAKLVETFRVSREEAYRAIVAGAERIRRKAEMGGGGSLVEQLGKLEREFRAERVRRKAQMGGGETLLEQLGKLEREFRAERRRDYFRSPLRLQAAEALKAAREAVRAREAATRAPGAEGKV